MGKLHPASTSVSVSSLATLIDRQIIFTLLHGLPYRCTASSAEITIENCQATTSRPSPLLPEYTSMLPEGYSHNSEGFGRATALATLVSGEWMGKLHLASTSVSVSSLATLIDRQIIFTLLHDLPDRCTASGSRPISRYHLKRDDMILTDANQIR